MFQFRRFPTTCYFIHKRLTEYCSAGFPHSDIHGSRAAFASPWLFVDRYVLLRLPMPRHSPCALISLIFSSLFVLRPIVLSLLYHFILHPFQNEELNLQLAFSVQIFSCCAVVKVQGCHQVGDWWVAVDSNHRPHAYQACALTNWANPPYLIFSTYELF